MAKKKTSKKTVAVDEDPVVKELVDIKRLMVLWLLRDGDTLRDSMSQQLANSNRPTNPSYSVHFTH